MNFIICGYQAASFAAAIDLKAPNPAQGLIGICPPEALLGQGQEGFDRVDGGDAGEQAEVDQFALFVLEQLAQPHAQVAQIVLLQHDDLLKSPVLHRRLHRHELGQGLGAEMGTGWVWPPFSKWLPLYLPAAPEQVNA